MVNGRKGDSEKKNSNRQMGDQLFVFSLHSMIKLDSMDAQSLYKT